MRFSLNQSGSFTFNVTLTGVQNNNTTFTLMLIVDVILVIAHNRKGRKHYEVKSGREETHIFYRISSNRFESVAKKCFWGAKKGNISMLSCAKISAVYFAFNSVEYFVDVGRGFLSLTDSREFKNIFKVNFDN